MDLVRAAAWVRGAGETLQPAPPRSSRAGVIHTSCTARPSRAQPKCTSIEPTRAGATVWFWISPTQLPMMRPYVSACAPSDGCGPRAARASNNGFVVGCLPSFVRAKNIMMHRQLQIAQVNGEPALRSPHAAALERAGLRVAPGGLVVEAHA